jgi:hypothetical protein
VSNLRPAASWKPGQSGNPGGRPSTKHLRDLLLAELERCPDKGNPTTNLQLGINMMVRKFVAGDLGTTKLLFGYVWGLPTQAVDISIIRAEAERLAAEVGCTADELIAEAERIAARIARDDGDE